MGQSSADKQRDYVYSLHCFGGNASDRLFDYGKEEKQ